MRLLTSDLRRVFVAAIIAGLSFGPLMFDGEKADAENPPPVLTKIGYIPITDHLLLGVAAARDAASFKHIKLEPVRFSDMVTVTEAIRSGGIDGGFIFAPLAFQAKLKGAPIKLVLLGHRNGSALIVRVNPEISNAADLRGATIAIPHRFSTHNMLLHLFTTGAGLAYGKDFQALEMPPMEMPSALAGHTIDGYIVAEPIGARGELLGVGRPLVLSHDIWADHPDCVLVLREQFIKDHPGAARELIASLIRAGEFAEEHRSDAVTIGHSFLGQPADALTKALSESKHRVTFKDLVPVRAELARLQDYMADKLGLFPERVDFDDLLDLSFAEGAAQNIAGGIPTRQLASQAPPL